MIVTNRLELNAYFAQLIWANLLIQDETVAKMWLSNDRVGSNVTPRSLMDSDGKSSFLSSESLKSDSLWIIGRLPKIMSFVFSRLSRRQLSKHQLRIRCKSFGIVSFASHSSGYSMIWESFFREEVTFLLRRFWKMCSFLNYSYLPHGRDFF